MGLKDPLGKAKMKFCLGFKTIFFCNLQSTTDANSYQELWNLWNVNEYEFADEKAPRLKPTPTNLSRVVENCPHIRFGGLEHIFVQMQLREVQETVVSFRETPLKKARPPFGHYQNNDCIPPPGPCTQRSTLGHFISGPIWAYLSNNHFDGTQVPNPP